MSRKNIIEYIIEHKNLTQAEIGEKLKSRAEQGKGKPSKVSQAVVSKWKITGKIPKHRQEELLKIAGIYWNIAESDRKYILNSSLHSHKHHINGKLIDSSYFYTYRDLEWSMLVKNENNQHAWYDIFSDELPTSREEWMDHDGNHNDMEFLAFVREAILVLTDAGINITPSPNSTSSLSGSDFELQDFITHYRCQIEGLQLWTREKFPAGGFRKALYSCLPGIALAQCKDHKFIDSLQAANSFEFQSFVLVQQKFIKNTIKEFEHNLIYEIDPNIDIHGYFDILNVDITKRHKLFLESPTSSDSLITYEETNFDEYLSYSERKIIEKLNLQEQRIKALQNKIDLLIKSLDNKTLIETSLN
jgi:hypothetical protein